MAYQQPSFIAHDRAAGSVIQAEEFVAGVFIASDRAAASVIHCMPKNSLQASVCVFSDRMMAHQHLEFVAGQRVCFF